MSKPKAIVIGAGIGGLATAIQLAIKGIEVTIFEKTNKPGGRCQRITKKGHVFDTGPTMYLFPDIYSSFFSSIGEGVNDYIKLLRSDPSYLLNFSDKSNFILSSDKQLMKNQFEAIEKGSYMQFLRFLKTTKHHYNFALQKITLKNLRYPWEYFNLNNLYFALAVGGVLVEVALCLLLGPFFKKRLGAQKFYLLRYCFLHFAPTIAIITLSFLLGLQVFKIFAYSAILGTLIEGIAGFSFHVVVGEKLWEYHRYNIFKYTSILSFPMWGFAGVLFMLIAQMFIK